MIRLFRQQSRSLPLYHAAGEQLHRLAEDANLASRGSGWRMQVASAVGVSESALNKCLQFRREYAEEEIPELESQGLRWSQLTIALGVANKQDRCQLLKQADDENWDDQTLQRAIQQMKGTRRGGGRRRKESKSLGLQPDLTRLIGLTDPWSKFYSEAWSGRQDDYRGEAARAKDGVRATLEELLEDAATKLKAMRKQCGDALTQVEALQEGLRPDAAE